ncbi:hypothetical protein GUJ93_ZPchr0001g30485 [Zizania palustris]|uniref:Uncharacterized protein n=1 Tax=Zizania palustris TaxID=103762 RepID=A0A8J5RLQ7_ZIZPA|nr:hypothetical protein GUJ93_ZPchr0001g30485 [Zizania palustris]
MFLIGTKTGLDTPYHLTRSALPLLLFGSAPTPRWRRPASTLLPIGAAPPLPVGAAPRSPSAPPLLLPVGAVLAPCRRLRRHPSCSRSTPSLLPVGAALLLPIDAALCSSSRYGRFNY